MQLGALAALESDGDLGSRDKQFLLLTEFGDRIGLAFQVMDDVLDVTQSTECLGKPAGSDEALNKSTFPKIMGTDQAMELAHTLVDEALALLKRTRLQTESLQALARLVVERDH